MSLFRGQGASLTTFNLEFVFHVYSNNDGITGVAITNEAYPSRIAGGLIGKIVNEFCVNNRDAKTATGPVPFPALKEYIDKYQNPQNVDNITQITEQLEDTKVTLHKTIESVSLAFSYLHPTLPVWTLPLTVICPAPGTW